jgi:hypothetical protein
VIVNGIRISGASGIYKSHDYHKGQCPFLRIRSRLEQGAFARSNDSRQKTCHLPGSHLSLRSFDKAAVTYLNRPLVSN